MNTVNLLTILLIVATALVMAIVVAALMERRTPRRKAGTNNARPTAEPPQAPPPPNEQRPGLFVENTSPDARTGAPTSGQFFVLPESPFEVGRAPVSRITDRSDVLRVDEPYVTRSHFKIEFLQDSGLYRIQDLKSVNGTELGEVPLDPFMPELLQHNDLIRIGNGMVFRFHQPSRRYHRLAPDRRIWGDLGFGRYLADGGMARIFEGNLKKEPLPSAIMMKESHLLEAERRTQLCATRPLKVAIKIPKDYDNPDQDQVEQIFRESRILADLLHPHLIWMVSAGRLGETDLRFLTYEYMPNGNLREWMATERQLPERVVREIAAQIADALIYIHARGIIHCDLKPDNILFDEHTRVRLTDFGIARTPDDPYAPEFGHQGYVSPEHMGSVIERSKVALTGASDVYSLGVILYEMLVGNRPCAPDESSHDHKPFRPPSDTVNISRDLDDLIMQMLETKPSNRPDIGQAFKMMTVAAS